MKQFLTLVLFGLISCSIKGQVCAPCSISILSLDSSSITLNPGQTLCIGQSATFTGTLTLNGGTICNEGQFIPKSFIFLNGTIVNHKIVSCGSIQLNNSNSHILNKSSGVITTLSDIIVSGGLLNNEGIINITGNLSVISGSCENSNIINCMTLTGSTITNSGIINTN